VRQNIIAREYVEEEAAHFVGGSQAERERETERKARVIVPPQGHITNDLNSFH
jgi:hypothetical protein